MLARAGSQGRPWATPPSPRQIGVCLLLAQEGQGCGVSEQSPARWSLLITSLARSHVPEGLGS
jgi:hypothetical protein